MSQTLLHQNIDKQLAQYMRCRPDQPCYADVVASQLVHLEHLWKIYVLTNECRHDLNYNEYIFIFRYSRKTTIKTFGENTQKGTKGSIVSKRPKKMLIIERGHENVKKRKRGRVVTPLHITNIQTKMCIISCL